MEPAFEEIGHPVSDYCFVYISNLDHAPTNPSASPEPIAQNYVHVGGKALLCINNFAKRDRLRGRPERMFWSDMMANSCVEGT